MRVPEGQPVRKSVECCAEFASLGIGHVIVAVPDAADSRMLGHLAELAEQTREMTPREG
jgi:hypothetical protein